MPSNSVNPINLPLDEEKLSELVEKGKDFALMNGLCYRSTQIVQNRNLIHFVPFMLLPTPFPESQFNKANKIQVTFNYLICSMANDAKFLQNSLEKTIQEDYFTKRLFDLYEIVNMHHKSKGGPAFELFLLRSDYLLDTDLNLRQIEINTIASSLCSLSFRMQNLNKYILHEISRMDLFEKIPENKVLKEYAKFFDTTFSLYSNNEAVVLFVVENQTTNIADQRLLEYAILKENNAIRIIRKTFQEVFESGKLTSDNELLIDDYIVAIIYYRTGYNPDDYRNEKEWDARLLMEKSKAFKIPSLKTQLAGMKKIQLSLAHNLDKFLIDSGEIDQIKSVLAEMYELTKDNIAKAIARPEKFVLKSQREGGGHNLFDDNLQKELTNLERSGGKNSWILMERIYSPTQKNYRIDPNTIKDPELNNYISELGIYGAIIYDEFNQSIVINETIGHLLRTKRASDLECGINSGFGALDNVLLV